MMDWEAYNLPMQAIPGHMERALTKGIVPGEFPSSSEAGLVFRNWERYANQVTRANDGRALVACDTEMPGVTPAMIDWWFGWHLSGPERYTLWHPRAHTWTKPKEDRRHLVDDREKYIGNVSYVNEYIGKSHKKLAIAFQKPEMFGIHNIDSSGGTAICARTSDRILRSEGGALVHLIIPVHGGCRMRSAFWLGEIIPHWPWIGGLFKRVLNTRAARKIIVHDRMAIDLLRHCAEEMNHLSRFLPPLYREVHASGRAN